MDAYQAISNVSGIQCQSIDDGVSSKSKSSVQTKKSDNNQGCFSSSNEVSMKQKLLQELSSLQLLQKELEKLTLEQILNETDLMVKATKKERLENMKTVVSKFVRDVLQDSAKENQESLVDEVKQAKRMAARGVFDAKKEIEKAEKKRRKLQVQSKKQEVHKSKKKK